MKKILCLILASLMMILSFVACSDPADNKGDESDTKAPSADSADTGEETTEKPEEILELPDETFGGEEFIILTPKVVAYNFAMCDFDEPSDDAYENAIYERNLAVEELLDIEIKEISENLGDDLYKVFKVATEANTGDYDITFNKVNNSSVAVGAGLCYSLDEFPYIDLDKSWWNKDCTDQLSLGGKHYMISGDIALSDKECIWCVYFTKSLIDAYGLENPYTLVNNGTWTWDKMHTMGRSVMEDVNSNGKMEYATDIFGIAGHGENWPAFWESAGLKLIELDSEGYPVLSWGTEEFVNAFEDIKAIMGDTECYSDDNQVPLIFKEGRTLFATEVIAHARQFRENEEDFGIIPFPKYTTDTERYNSYIAVSSCVLTVGNDCTDTYKTSIIVEALAAYGQQILTPAYYEGQLKSRTARDEESAAMLDIIFEQRSYDLGVFFNWGSAYTSLQSVDANPAVLYTSLQKSINKSIEKSLEKLGLY